MDYIEPLFRPPSEAHSLLLQITVGCAHNRCTFCAMYAAKKFRVKPLETVFADIDEAAASRFRPDRVFLMDGDALIAKTDHLLAILNRIRERLPMVERVGIYGDARCIAHKSDEDLRALREAGLGMVYHGIESGHDEVLALLNKGSTAQEAQRAALRIRAAGMQYSAIVLLGAGGIALSRQHAIATARHLNAVQPDYVGALMLTVVPGTPLADMVAEGSFVMPDKFGLLAELKIMLEHLHLEHTRFSANHASNYLPIKGNLPHDRQKMLALVSSVLETRDESVLKPEWLRGL